MPVTIGFNHVATLTANLDKIVKFYTDAVGATKKYEIQAAGDHPRMAVVDLGDGAALNVFEVPAEAIIGDRRQKGGRGPIDHFALAVDSLETLQDTRDRLRRLGAGTGEIQRLGSEWSLFFRDPDGMELEICCHADQ